jgi:adenosylcobinamide-GDP ribazoletransferase
MVKGNKEKKYQVIHDPRIGSAGAIGLISYSIGMIIIISSFTDLSKLIYAILIAEVVAKYAMVVQAYIGKSAWEGYSSLFTKNMKFKKKIISSTLIAIFLVIMVGPTNYFIGGKMFITGIITSIILTYISNKSFGGITGDTMGATNEITRLCCLIAAL